jgi:hypothetical protein
MQVAMMMDKHGGRYGRLMSCSILLNRRFGLKQIPQHPRTGITGGLAATTNSVARAVAAKGIHVGIDAVRRTGLKGTHGFVGQQTHIALAVGQRCGCCAANTPDPLR